MKKLLPKRLFAVHCSLFTGFTLIELLIVIAVIGVLAVVVFSLISSQIAKARDAQRKTDLTNIKKALEDYLIQNQCYPATLPGCGQSFDPYLKTRIPCDPVTGQPYPYEPEPVTCPSWYRLYSKLEYTADPAVTEVGCTSGCGPGGSYNWGVTSGNVSLSGGGGGGTPTPQPTPAGYFGCKSGVCTALLGPVCQPNYLSSNCFNQCGTPSTPENECQ